MRVCESWPGQHIVRMNITTGTVTSRVPEEVFKDCEAAVNINIFFFNLLGEILHYKIQVHSKESYTITLYTAIVLLHYELQV